MCLPVYGLLLDKSLRTRLGMSKVQQKKLVEIATKCQADQEKGTQRATKSGPTAPCSTLTRRVARSTKRGTPVRKQIEALLTPAQLAALKAINFRQQVSQVLKDPFEQEQMGLSRGQKAAVDEALRAAREADRRHDVRCGGQGACDPHAAAAGRNAPGSQYRQHARRAVRVAPAVGEEGGRMASRTPHTPCAVRSSHGV